jgi:hypothetical protein
MLGRPKAVLTVLLWKKQPGKREKEVDKCRCFPFTFVTVGGTTGSRYVFRRIKIPTK